MALDTEKLKTDIANNLVQCGFTMLAQSECLCEAIAKAVIKNIQDDAEVEVTSGDSAGTYKVK